MKITRTKKILVCLLGLSIYTIPLLTIDGALFLESKGLKGESDVPGYEGWVEIDSFQVGAGVGISSVTGGSNREISNPSLSEMTISKSFDSSSTTFFGSLVVGTNYPDLRVFLAPTTNPGRLIKIHLRDVLISGYSMSSGGDRPSESVSLNYTAIRIEHFMTDSKGTETIIGEASWDLAKQTPWQ